MVFLEAREAERDDSWGVVIRARVPKIPGMRGWGEYRIIVRV
jgi:hypothetical protein